MSVARFEPDDYVRDFTVPVVDRLKRRLLAVFLANGIQTEDHLHFFIRIYLGYQVPREHYCPEHVSPFSFIADQFFERVKTVFGFANRNGGKTLEVAMLNILDALFKPGIEVVSAGAIKDQADKGYDYVIRMLVNNPLLGRYVVSSLRSQTAFVNGSVLELTTGTFHGLNSKHPTKTRIDEIELMHPILLQEGLQMSISSSDGRWKAGDTLTSTRKFAAGTVQRLLNEAKQKNIAIYSWCIFEILQRCTRQCKADPVYGNCPVYSRINKDGEEEPICGGKAHDLPSGGFYTIEDYVQKVQVLDKDTYETQWENKRPQGGSLVYGRFFNNAAPFVVEQKEAAELLIRAQRENWARVIGIDWGSNFYAGYYMEDPLTDIWYQYHEYWYSHDMDLPLKDHGINIRQAGPLEWSYSTAVFADPSGRQAIRDLETFNVERVGEEGEVRIEELGITITPANNDVYSGINHLKKLFQRRQRDRMPGLRIFSSCERVIKELTELYVHRLNKDGTVNKDVIVKKDDHGCDALRYGLFSFVTVGTGTYRLRKLRGVW